MDVQVLCPVCSVSYSINSTFIAHSFIENNTYDLHISCFSKSWQNLAKGLPKGRAKGLRKGRRERAYWFLKQSTLEELFRKIKKTQAQIQTSPKEQICVSCVRSYPTILIPEVSNLGKAECLRAASFLVQGSVSSHKLTRATNGFSW